MGKPSPLHTSTPTKVTKFGPQAGILSATMPSPFPFPLPIIPLPSWTGMYIDYKDTSGATKKAYVSIDTGISLTSIGGIGAHKALLFLPITFCKGKIGAFRLNI